MFVYDFTPVAQTFDLARQVLASDAATLLDEATRAAYQEERGGEGVHVNVGPMRSRDETLVVGLAWSEPHGSAAELEGEVELAPLGPGISHLSLSANYEFGRGGLGRRVDLLQSRRATEALVRAFLLRVAQAIEHTDARGRCR